MKKSNFFKLTLMLVIGGFITKILGMVIKIVTTRYIGAMGMGIYMLIMPTYSLLIAISGLGFPVAISKLVAEEKYNNKNIVLGLIPISLILDFTIMILLFIFSKYISIHLLHESRTYYGLISIGFILPFISISSILRAYFFGKTYMFPHVLSNVLEDVIRLVLIILFLPNIYNNSIEYAVAFLFLISIASELSSIIIFMLFLPKKIKISKNDFSIKNDNLKKVLNISLPTTGSRLIGNIGYFLEPIILTFVLSNIYSNKFIVTEYGILNGYVMPILLLPSFFTMAISQALIPIISNYWSKNNNKMVLRKIKQAIFYSLLIGIPATLIFMFIPQIPMKLIYNTTDGIAYIKVLAPICLFHYIQSPLTSALQAMGLAKEAMNGTLIGMIIRTICLFVLSYLHIGLWGLVIATSINIIVVTIHQMIKIKNVLKK